MADLLYWQYALIGLVFVWSGFVRTGLGFGGAVLTLPFLLLILDQPLVFLPIIAIQYLFFAALNIWISHLKSSDNATIDGTVDWPYFRKSLKIMIVPKFIGVLGLLTLPNEIMSAIIYFIVIVYSISYILNRPFKSNKPWLDNVFLVLGGYVSGTSLIGAPLVMAVVSAHVDKHKLRDTVFALLFLLVLIKVLSFVAAGVNLHMEEQFWLLPCAYVGPIIGNRLHGYRVKTEQRIFYKILGYVLIAVSSLGMLNTLGNL